MKQIFLREIQVFFNSLIGYVVIVIFLVSIWLFLWLSPSTNILDSGYAHLDIFFFTLPYIFIFFTSSITMRSFAEERKQQTLQFLFTKPIRIWELILGKFLGSVFLICISLLLTLTYFFTIYQLALPVGNVDIAAIIGSYMGLLLLSVLFCAVGVLVSSMTQQQVIAFIISTFLNFILYIGIPFISEIPILEKYAYPILWTSPQFQYEVLSKGLLSFSSLFYFLSFSFFILQITYFQIKKMRE